MRKFAFDRYAPFLLAAYPIIFLASNNIHKVDYSSVAAALAFSLMAAGGLLLITRLLLRDWHRSRFVTALILLLFFSYGHVYVLFQELKAIPLFPFDQEAWLLGLWAVLFLAGLLFTVRGARRLPAINRLLGMIASVLIVMALVSSTLNLVLYRNTKATAADFATQAPSVLPDIYYIILDEYAGNSSLLNYLGYDNSPFTDSLRDRGFYVAADAHANYFRTTLSLASSLNMEYLDTILQQPDPETAAIEQVKNNRTVQALKALGYHYIHFTSRFAVTRTAPLADTIYNGYDDRTITIANLVEIDAELIRANDFYITLGKTTLLLPLMDMVASDDSRARNLYNLEKMAEIPSMPQPTFTLAHFVLPHTPYVFNQDDGPVNPNGRMVDGKIVNPDQYAAHSAYIDQIVFTNRAISQLVDTLLAESSVPPIILIQGDHGFRWLCSDCYNESSSWDDTYYANVVLPVLSAYYLPDGGDRLLTPQTSPVNSFRVIFDHYFGAELGLLENRYYRSADYYRRPFEVMDITQVVNDAVSAP